MTNILVPGVVYSFDHLVVNNNVTGLYQSSEVYQYIRPKSTDRYWIKDRGEVDLLKRAI